MTPLRIAIIGTGSMAHTHAKAYAAMPQVSLSVAVECDDARRTAFMETYGIADGYADLAAALADDRFDAASNVTPDRFHCETTLQLLDAGKHVLCEKPLAETYADAALMRDRADAAGVVNMVNLSYRAGAGLQKARALVEEGAIGAPRHFEASYLQSWLTQPAWGDWRTEEQWLWRLSKAHGSTGVLGDVGVHILDFVCFASGALPRDVGCHLTTFAKADGDRIGEYNLDASDSMVMNITLTNGASGVVHASRFASGHFNDLRLRLFGTSGGLEVGFENGVSSLRLCTGEDLLTATWHDVPLEEAPDNYTRFVEAVWNGGTAVPDFSHGAALQQALDAALASDATKMRVDVAEIV